MGITQLHNFCRLSTETNTGNRLWEKILIYLCINRYTGYNNSETSDCGGILRIMADTDKVPGNGCKKEDYSSI